MVAINTLSLPRKAYLFAKLSGISYKNARKGSRNFRRLGFKSTFLNNGGNEAYILESDTDLVFVCRGTEVSKWSDIREDLTAFKVPFDDKGARVHKGFYEGVKNLLPEFVKRINASKGKKVWCAGHSLGAAMITIFALLMFNDQSLPNPEAIFTYGCPRVGNRKFAQLVNNTGVPNYRFVNNGDIVPRVPVWGYKHAGTLNYISFYGEVMPYTHKQRIKDIWHGFFKLLRARKISFFSDHAIFNSYYPAVKHWAMFT